MNRLLILFAFLFQFLSPVFPQQAETAVINPSLKYGKPSDEELNMITYAPDTAATAVVLCSKSRARYELISNEFKLIYTYEVKIKVLKSEGTSYADINIPYYSNQKNIAMKEQVTQIDASSYNMEEGKMVRTKMKRDLIFEERINNKYMQIKFSIPAVRAGSVFEYKYQLTSDFYYSINHWEAQKEIPVLFTQYDIVIPEYFKFNLDARGSHFLNPKDEADNLSFTLRFQGGQMETVNCTGRHLEFTGNQLPALRADSYVWCPEDYRSGVSFELRGIDFPGSIYKSFTHTWTEIDKMLLEDEDFGSLLKMKNPYREEMASLPFNKITNQQEKIAAIYQYLKKKISWNEQYGLYGNEIKKAIKNGTGNNAEINFVLMSMLREAEIPCYPVVMSRKNLGILPLTHPSLQKLNTFVVGIADTDSTFVYLDGSVTHGYLNVLPPVLMVERARLISNERNNWVNLTELGKNQIRSIIKGNISADGKITGTRQCGYYGQHASNFRKRYQTAKDSAEFVSKLETEENIKIKKFSTKELNLFSPKLSEHFEFEKQATVNDNLIYVNPMVFMHVSKSPFIQTERQLPVEMPYVEQLTIASQLTIPEGYAIEELPKSMSIRTEDGLGTCRFSAVESGNIIVVTYNFTLSKLFYLAEEYKGLKSFWESIAEKNNEIVVLKKL